jgi:glycosyltransferase involved in cell wall biosynthesis
MLETDSASFQPKVTVVIPILNEARNLPYVFSKLLTGLHEVIVVDGHSVDDTLATARRLRPDVRIIMQNRCGKGNALACGFAAATGDIIAMVDADGSADPSEVPQFVDALLDVADFAKGTRLAQGSGSTDITRLRRLGSRFFSTFFNMCYGAHYADLCYGFWRSHIPVLDLDVTSLSPEGSDGRLWGDGFEIETLIHIRIAEAGLIVTEVPSFEHARIHGASNLSAFGDSIRILRIILTNSRLSRKRKSAFEDIAEAAPFRRSAVTYPFTAASTAVTADRVKADSRPKWASSEIHATPGVEHV